MYRISKRMLKKGEIFDRGTSFYLFGYEYTLRMPSEDVFINNFTNWLSQTFRGRVKHNYKKEDGTLIVLFFDTKFEFARHRQEGENVMYHAFFSRWMENTYDVSEGNEMNQLLTGLELLMLQTDPLTWVRDMWVPRNIVDHVRTFEVWKTKYPEYNFTPEDIKERHYNNGRPFEEKYLADRLRGYGANVYGGSSMSPTGTAPSNPLVTDERQRAAEKMKKVKDKEEEKKAEAAKPKICPSCGRELPKGSRFCGGCGAKLELTLEEKKAEEVTKKEYQMFYIRETDEGGEPYIYPNIDEELNPVAEAADGTMYSYQLDGIKLSKKLDGEKGYKEIVNIISHDNYLYITDSRIMVINRKYNKNDAGSWVGFGSVTAMVVGEALTAAGRAVESHKRKGKAMIGQLRYEWISIVRYKEKNGVLSYPMLEIYYKDLNKTTWCLELFLKNGEGGAYSYADYLLHKLALHRARMDDKKDDDMQKFIDKYSDMNQHVPTPAQEGEYAKITVPEFFFATKGKINSPWWY
ncbi:MAG: zinc ribbon domain-containing protein [Eubacterium sp.]|nr:zinc ribbon domain-containing protein [Eubacterium sp.]